MSGPRVKTCPMMEIISSCLFGFSRVPAEYQQRMVNRAAREASVEYQKLEKENAELKQLFKKAGNLLLETSEWMRNHNGLGECPFCMGELFDGDDVDLLGEIKKKMEELSKEKA